MTRLKFFWVLCLALLTTQVFAKKVWVDADTGNEMDDVYAIVRILAEPSVTVVGISSVHFNNPDLVVFDKWNQYPTAGIKTVEISQKLNEELLRVMGRRDVPAVLGADRQMGRAWGGYEPRPSPAASALTALVHALPQGEQLDILCLGALTNIASAIAIDPSIVPKIKVYALGAKFNVTKAVWDKNEFNIRNDLNAFDYLLNSTVDFTVMPIDVVREFQFTKEDTYAKLSTAHPAHKNLKDRWEETNPQDKIRILWDLALVEAYLQPSLVTVKSVSTPAENTSRQITAYTAMDVKAVTADFWRVVLSLK